MLQLHQITTSHNNVYVPCGKVTCPLRVSEAHVLVTFWYIQCSPKTTLKDAGRPCWESSVILDVGIFKRYKCIMWCQIFNCRVKVRIFVFNATFNNISVISWQSMYWWRKPEYQKKITDLQQVTDKLHRIRLHSIHLTVRGIELTMAVVIVVKVPQSIVCFYLANTC